MTTTRKDLVWIPLGPDSRPHPGIVIVVVPAGVIVVAGGTGTLREHYPHITVRARSRDGMALGLTKDTHFYESNVVALPAARVAGTGRRCPPQLFTQLEQFAAPAVQRLLQP
jgi:hypothetical protein